MVGPWFHATLLVAFRIEGVNFGNSFLARWRYLCYIFVPGSSPNLTKNTKLNFPGSHDATASRRSGVNVAVAHHGAETLNRQENSSAINYYGSGMDGSSFSHEHLLMGLQYYNIQNI